MMDRSFKYDPKMRCFVLSVEKKRFKAQGVISIDNVYHARFDIIEWMYQDLENVVYHDIYHKIRKTA